MLGDDKHRRRIRGARCCHRYGDISRRADDRRRRGTHLRPGRARRGDSLLADASRRYGLRLRRFKTGTPPRVNARSVFFKNGGSSPATQRSSRFPSTDAAVLDNRAVCYLTYTKARTHRSSATTLTAVRSSTAPLKAPVRATAPRSRRRSSRLRTRNATSSSLNRWVCIHRSCIFRVCLPLCPEDDADRVVRSIPGLENAEMQRCAYAIEYDCVDPTEPARATLEKKDPRSVRCGAVQRLVRLRSRRAGIRRGRERRAQDPRREPFDPAPFGRRDTSVRSSTISSPKGTERAVPYYDVLQRIPSAPPAG